MSRAPAATRLVRRARRRLHAAAVAAVARRAAWGAAGVVLAGGLVHLLRGVPPAGVTLAVALAVLGVPAAVAAVVRRPSLDQAALRADAWLGTRGLFTAALDQRRRPPAARAGAAPVVLAQADAAAAGALRRLATAAPRAGVGRLYAPVAVALAGAFLHLAPVRTPAPARPAAAATPASLPGRPDRTPVAPARRVAEDGEVRRTGAGGVPSPIARAGGAPAAPGTAAGRGAGRGASGGTAPGGGAGVAGGTTAAAGALPEIVWVDLPRAAAGAGGGAVPLAPGGAPAPAAPGAAPPAPRPAGVAVRDVLPPATRAYAAAYLRSLEAPP